MDETEITNNEYRPFINWVRDSIAHVILGRAGIEDHLITEDKYDNFRSIIIGIILRFVGTIKKN